jgi:primosomal protein N'
MYADVVINTPLEQRFTYLVGQGCEGAALGMRAIVPFGKREVTAYVVALREEIEPTSYRIKQIKRLVDKEPIFGPREIELARWMARFYLCSEGEALSTMIPGGRRDVDPQALPIEEDVIEIASEQLSEDQKRAIEAIGTSAQRLHYVYGVTGSGKSEVFLRVAQRVIAEGRQVIYLVPEITLTHQLARQVARRFEGKVAILHSGMTPSQRLSAWRKIKRGSVQIAIGARSAVYAPFERLGLVITTRNMSMPTNRKQPPLSCATGSPAPGRRVRCASGDGQRHAIDGGFPHDGGTQGRPPCACHPCGRRRASAGYGGEYARRAADALPHAGCRDAKDHRETTAGHSLSQPQGLLPLLPLQQLRL